ncbi:MAG TPA: thioredoxin-dependent thiol peroxidase [Candidatus Limnocylindria bacterium]|nr:thioredoxin-dependent thiol peroxidase [Candidatus Limnocylindria bacterium]
MATSLLPVIGKPAPDFSLPSTTGENVSLRQFKGKKTVILYFYPKDETPGCTREACDFRELTPEFEKHNTVILGVSTDGLESHLRFRDKHKLPFPLLADEDTAVSKMFGVYKQRNLYGKKYMGIERTTFVIDKTGRIAQIYPKVKVDGHIQNLLEFVRED